MALKILQISAPLAAEETLAKLAKQYEAISFERGVALDDDHSIYSILTRPKDRQAFIDDLNGVLQTSARARITICPVDATLPAPKTRSSSYTREELYQKLMHGAEVSGTYMTLGALSTLVALIGLLQDNVAVVIGAMVIAPLLGPNLAFAFGTALGDRAMLKRATSAALIGLAISIIISAITGLLWGDVPVSDELMSRTHVGLDGVALAVAAGVAGVMSLTTGLSMTLVGVMVAVALAPPAATLGFMLGTQNYPLAIGAFMLLSVNIVCVNLSALTVFLAKGFTARSIFHRRIASRYIWTGLISWAAALGGLIWAISYLGVAGS